MKTFKQFVEDKQPQGNYVSVTANLPQSYYDFIEGLDTKYKPIASDKLHSTLMYSPTTDHPESDIHDVLYKQPQQFDGKIADVHSIPYENNPSTHSIVMQVDSPELVSANKDLADIGLKHTYSPYMPHVSAFYGVHEDDAADLVHKLKSNVIGTPVSYSGYNVEPIKE